MEAVVAGASARRRSKCDITSSAARAAAAEVAAEAVVAAAVAAADLTAAGDVTADIIATSAPNIALNTDLGVVVDRRQQAAIH